MSAFRIALLVLSLPPASLAAEPSFRKEVAPLLRQRCLSCHSGKRARGDLALISRAALLAGGASGPAVRPGKATESLLFRHVRDRKMPPRQPLSDAEVALLRRWIDAGAVWEGPALAAIERPASRAGSEWWSLQPILRPAVPAVRQRLLVRGPIDAFLLARLEAHGLSFTAEADRRSLVRRVTFDLTGLPPTPEEVDAFVADARPDAYERLVERLLASPQHGERWARHWLDVARFAESHGYETNAVRPNAWPYRDWAIRAFNADLHFGRFVREQLAGDVLAGGDALTQAATGFLVGGPHDLVGNATVEGTLQQRSDDLFDMVTTTATAFLGLTVGCARCHDHKFDPISQTDFYALQAVFAGVVHAEREMQSFPPAGLVAQRESVRRRLGRVERQLDEEEPLAGAGPRRAGVEPGRNVERFRPVKAVSLRFVIEETTDGTEPCIDELELYGPGRDANLARAGGVKASASSTYPNNPLHRLEHINDGRVGNSRSWISAERGKGWVRLDLPTAAVLDRVVWGRDREGRFRDRLAKTYRIEVSADGAAWKTVAGSTDRLAPGRAPTTTPARARLLAERGALSARLAELTAPRKVYAGTFRTPEVSYRLHRGDVMQKREAVAAGALAAVRPRLDLEAGASESKRRLALAEWIAHPDNPLPARVLVNRLWHWHFGHGLVRTPSDFGANGDRPSHPELLDWLASELLASGGRFKHLHRLVVLSRAYRQGSAADARAATIDAGNRLLWRAPPRRLEAEAIRDAMLHVSGALDLRMGGPGYQLWDARATGQGVFVFTPKARLGLAEHRRMIYQFKPRLQQDGTFGVFDCPDATAAVPRRNTSTTPLQALNLLNDPFVLDQAERFAARVRREAGASVPEQVERAFRLALGRAPSAVEAAAGERLAGAHGLALLCRALFNSNEFVSIH
jgi:hypothetical protein